ARGGGACGFGGSARGGSGACGFGGSARGGSGTACHRGRTARGGERLVDGRFFFLSTAREGRTQHDDREELSHRRILEPAPLAYKRAGHRSARMRYRASRESRRDRERQCAAFAREAAQGPRTRDARRRAV